jgi:hypothetical protein
MCLGLLFSADLKPNCVKHSKSLHGSMLFSFFSDLQHHRGRDQMDEGRWGQVGGEQEWADNREKNEG